MINELTHKDGERVALNSFRYAWTVIANIFIYAMASILLGLHSSNNETDITPADAHIFRTLAFIVVGVGLLCMLIFHLGVRESAQPAEETEHRLQLSLTASGRLKRMTWISFLKEKQFYQCAFIWMCARVILNVTQVKRIIGSIHLSIFYIGFCSSVHHRYNQHQPYLCGCRTLIVLHQWSARLVSHANDQQNFGTKANDRRWPDLCPGQCRSVLVSGQAKE